MRSKNRPGFTLIEILVVIAILLMLTVAVVAAINFTGGANRIREGARSAQAAFLGAKDRALHAKEQRGIRLLRDANDLSLVNGFAYCAPVEPQRYGGVPPVSAVGQTVQIENFDLGLGAGPQPILVHGISVDWMLLQSERFLPFPRRIRIPIATNGQWYSFGNVTPGLPNEATLILTTPYQGAYMPGASGSIAVPPNDPMATCEIAIGTELLPNHAPMSLPSGMVIDLNLSSIQTFQTSVLPANVPLGWLTIGPDPNVAGNVLVQPPNIDIMFTPRGAITGPASAGGPLYFLLRDLADATARVNPIAADAKESMVLAVHPMTGHVQAYPIDPTDADANTFADDLFRFARTGNRAGN
ncbi:MAG: type II secretion system protein [Planctomycetaceae bacterium]